MDEKLLFKYFNGETTPDEEKAILELIDSSDADRQEFYDLKAIWNAVQGSSGKEAAAGKNGHRRSSSSVSNASRGSSLRFWIYSAAACIIVALSLLLAFRPAGRPSVRMMTCVNPGTEVYEMRLPDNSTVYLKPDSKITYPESFDDHSRNVTLEGEAFFDVVRDPASPFTVSTDYFKVRVLGTSFNVKAPSESRFASVLLKSGSVKVLDRSGKPEVTLAPDEEAVYSVSTGCIQVAKTNASYYALVQYSLVTMENASLSEIIDRIDAMYGVKLKANVSNDSRRFNFNFMKTSSLDDLVRILEILTGNTITY